MPVDIKTFSLKNSTIEQLSRKPGPFFLVLLSFVFAASAWSASFYTQRLEDSKAVYVAPSGGDDTAALQKAVNQVQETTGQGIVLLAPGRYHISVTPPGIGADQDSLGPLLPVASGQFPPPPDAFHRELRRVMRHADVDHRPVLSDLVCPVGNRFALRHGWEIVNVDPVRLSLWPPRPAPVFKGSHQFF